MRSVVIGDVHAGWDARDVAWVDGLEPDAVLFVGDLPTTLHRDLLPVARRIAALRSRAYLIPGNHDGPAPWTLLVDAATGGRRSLGDARAHAARIAALRVALGPVVLCGFSVHALGDLHLVAARPHAMGGTHASFAPYLARRFGVGDLVDSADRLRRLVDRVPRRAPIVFLAHNGPSGFGVRGPWGVGRRDLGDPDLAAAVAHARSEGHPVPAVVAGHVHHRGDDGPRPWTVRRDGTLYVNAARHPRIARGRHHAVELIVEGDEAHARELRTSVSVG